MKSSAFKIFSCLFPSILSSAPDFIKPSILLLFKSFCGSLFIKFSRERNFPFKVLSLTIASDTAFPTPFMVDSPNLMPSLSTLNAPSPRFTSGGNIFIPISARPPIYSISLVGLSLTEVSEAAINSFG